eukprot:jgi/Mesvir1/27814/Mv07494-RA.1
MNHAHPLTLQDMIEVPGIGPLIVSSLPLVDRARLMVQCRGFRAAVGESLMSLTGVTGEDVAGVASVRRALRWVGERDRARAFAIPVRIGIGVSAAIPMRVADQVDVHSAIAELAPKCPCLARVDLSGCDYVSDSGIKAMGAHCGRGMVCLELGGSSATALASPICQHNEPRQHGPCGRMLCHLNVAGCRGVSDASMKTLAGRPAPLAHLDVSSCQLVTDDGMNANASNSPALVHLAVSACPGVTDASIRAVREICRGLMHLDVTHCEGVTRPGGVDAVRGMCVRLHRLVAASRLRLLVRPT